MFEGSEIEDEVQQNVFDQQHPVDMSTRLLAPTREMVIAPGEYNPPAAERVLGLSQRQMDLIHNVDTPQPYTGAARERRLQILHRDIDSINKFLPYMDQVRGFMSTMPTDDDEGLIEALALSDMKLKQFISDIIAKLDSLEQELELKKVVP